MGVNEAIYGRVVQAAERTNSLIFIRKTSEGSVLPFAQQTGVGKKLPTKGKSSNAHFTSGNIPFFASLSKKVVNWAYEQQTLIGVTTATKTNQPTLSRYAYIPKLIGLDDERVAVAHGARPPGVTEVGADLLVEIASDSLGGRTQAATYYLRRTTFGEATSSYANPIAHPSFVSEDNTPCYQVFIARTSIYTHQAFEAIKAAITTAVNAPSSDQTRPKWLTDDIRSGLAADSGQWVARLSPKYQVFDANAPDFRALKGINAQYVWEHYWYVQVGGGSQPSPLERFATPTTFAVDRHQEIFYPVNVLALLTKGMPREEGVTAQREKKLYEVVADYDVFMIAPHVDLLRNTLMSDGGQSSSSSLPSVPTGRASIVGQAPGDQGLRLDMVAFRNRFIPTADTGRARYGIASSYEIKEVRRAINSAMAINAVQHGTEVANVFHISDIQEPVMMFAPGARSTASDLFFLNLDLLFRLFKPDSTGLTIEGYRPGKEMQGGRYDPDYEVNITIPADHPLRSHAFLFNLNWGTDYYIDRTMPAGLSDPAAYRREQTAAFEALASRLQDDVFRRPVDGGTIDEHGRHDFNSTDQFITTVPDEFNRLFSGYRDAPVPIRTFMLFLYQHCEIMEKARPLIRLSGGRDPLEDLAVKLLFWGYYYRAVYDQCEGFARWVHAENYVDEVRRNYRHALRAIAAVAQRLLPPAPQTRFARAARMVQQSLQQQQQAERPSALREQLTQLQNHLLAGMEDGAQAAAAPRT
jgi:hypothetical protein